MPKEYLFTTDNFKNPEILEDKKAISVLLVRLILLEPGTNPVRPNMGVGLVSKYRYTDTQNIVNLEKNITSQINTYLPMFQTVDVGISVNGENALIIEIRIDDTVYKYQTVEQNNNNVDLVSLLS